MLVPKKTGNRFSEQIPGSIPSPFSAVVENQLVMASIGQLSKVNKKWHKGKHNNNNNNKTLLKVVLRL